MATLKEQLYSLCESYIRDQEAEIKKLIAEAQEAANNETKSSAGDKYETAREVMQQDINLNLARLGELSKLRTTLEHINPAQAANVALPGSVVYSNNGNFYIAISAGQVTVDGVKFFCISPASPIGSKLLGNQPGYSFDLNGKSFVIENVV